MFLQFLFTLLVIGSCVGVEMEDYHLYAYRVGCYKDQADDRDLPEISSIQSNLTVRLCFDKCRVKHFKYAGVQAGKLCFCSDSYGHHGGVNDEECKTPCLGDASSYCGGTLRNFVYETGKIKTLDYYRLGCFKDTAKDTDLPEKIYAGPVTTKHHCFNYCGKRNFKFAAAQRGKYCYCGDVYNNTNKADDANCNAPCAGDRRETCGGRGWSEVFKTDRAKQPVVKKLGCFIYQEDKDLPTSTYKAGASTTRHLCLDHCKKQGFKYAGVRGGDTCSCSDFYGFHGKAADTECNATCLGDSRETCGGKDRDEVYETGVNKTIRSRVFGCFNAENRTTAQKDLPNMNTSSAVMTYHFCLVHCKKYKFRYAGVQAGRFCSCGDTHGRYGRVSDSDCGNPCAGDAKEKCGGTFKTVIFESGYNDEIGKNKVGCYKIRNTTELVALYSKSLPGAMTRIYCYKFCKAIQKYKYAFLVTGDYCYCDKDITKLTSAMESECNRPCRGDNNETCGGKSREIQEVFKLF